MTCTEIYGNGATTIGWMTTLPLRETAVFIKTKIVVIASLEADRGMSHLNFAVVQRDYEYCNPMQMSLWGFEWFVILLNVEKIQSLMMRSIK